MRRLSFGCHVVAIALIALGSPAWSERGVLSGSAEVTGKAGRGLRFEFGGGRCGPLGYSEWRDAAGAPVAREELTYVGDRWQRYRLERLSVAQDVVAVREGRVIRVDIRDGDRRRQERLEAVGEVLAGPTLIVHLQQRLPDLERGRVIEMQYLVAEQAMVLSLRASKAANGAGGLTNVRIEASSALLRPFVPTTLVTFDADGRFIAMQGRLLPQLRRSVALDGVMRVSYPDDLHVASMKSICNNRVVS